MTHRYKSGDYVWVVGCVTRDVGVHWVGTVVGFERTGTLEVAPLRRTPGELNSFWRDWELRPASLLDAIAEAAG